MNWPTSLDTLTNPAGGDLIATVDHASQHSNANDLLELIERYLGTNASQTTPTGANRVLASTSSSASTWTATPTLTDLTLTGALSVATTSTLTGAVTLSATGTAMTSAGDVIMANDKKLYFRKSTGVADHYIYEDVAGSNLLFTLGTASKAFVFRNVTPTNVFSIDTNTSSVNVLVGYALKVYGSGGTANLGITNDNTNSVYTVSTGGHYFQDTGSSQRLILDTGGVHTTGFHGPVTNNVDSMGSAEIHHTDVFGQNAYTTVSDRNEKENLVDEPLGLDFIMGLQPKEWKWKDFEVELPKVEDGIVVKDDNGQVVMETKTITHHRKHHGFVAQDIEQLLVEKNVDPENFAGFIKDENSGKYALRYAEFIAPMIKSIQEQQTVILYLKQRLEQLEGK